MIKSVKINKKGWKFFEDRWTKKQYQKIKFTTEEADIFEKFETAIWYDNAGKYNNGSWSKLEVDDYETDEDGDLIYCWAVYGVDDCDHKSEDSWKVVYNRKTKKFEEA